MRILRIAALFAITLPVTSALFAGGLEWEVTKVSLKTDFGEEKVVALYPFTNTSKKSIEITSTHASCGCTVPSLEKTEYGPGESGTLTAVFEIGGRTGKQHKEIEVETNEPGSRGPYLLSLDVEIPEAVKLRRRAMIWKAGSELKPQTGTVEVHPELGFVVDGFKHQGPQTESNFDIEITPTENPHTYQITVTPKKAEGRVTEYIVLTSSDDDGGHLSRYRIALYVR